jgi:hypothetical protein|nr:MAG TPA: hypothetical protein [Caudoviricetes sp.]
MKKETNLEHYKDVLKNIPFQRMTNLRDLTREIETRCNGHYLPDYISSLTSDFIGWAKQPYREIIELTKFEFDMIQTAMDITSPWCRFETVDFLQDMKWKGYFENVDVVLPLDEIQKRCEVVEQ